MLIFHILTALTSIAGATVLLFKPRQMFLYLNYAFALATLISGTYLIVSVKTHIIEACLMGLFYLAGVSFCIAVAQRKLALGRLYKSSKK